MNAAQPKNLLFESLRGLAAFAVLLFHLWGQKQASGFSEVARFGWVGVNLFFALSGFLIARSVLTPEKFHFPTYAKSRALRILPAYFASIVILLGIQNTHYLVAQNWPTDLALHAGLIHAWFGDGIMWSINYVYWTLSHEWSFYLLMGLAAPLVRRFSGSWPMVVGLIAVTVLVRWGWITGNWTLPNGHLHPLCVWEQFAFGILAAALCHQWQNKGKLPRDSVLLCVLLVGLVSVTVGLLRYHVILDSIPEDKLGTPTSYLAILKAFGKKKSIFLSSQLLISFGFGCVLLVAWLRGSVLTKWLRFTPLPWMGMVSYSTYLWHLPVIICIANLKRRAATTPGLSRWLDEPFNFVTLALVLSYLLSWISYKGLEMPYFQKREGAR